MSSDLKTLLALLFTLSYTCGLSQEQSFEAIEQSLFDRLERVETRRDSVDIYNDLAYNYRRTLPSDILKYADISIYLGQTIAYTKGLAYAYKNKGIAYYKLSNARDSAIFFFEQAVAYAERADDYYTMAACINNIGLVQMRDLEFNQAIQNFLRCLAVLREKNINTPYLKALVIGNIGKAYERQGKYSKAIEYFQEALDLGDQHDLKTIISIYSDDIANTYIELGREEEAITLLEQVLPIQEEIGDYQSKVKILLRYSTIYLQQGKAEAGLDYAQRAYNLSKKQGFEFIYSSALVLIAKNYLQLNKIAEAEQYALSAYENIMDKTPSLNELRTLHVLVDISVFKEDYLAAFKHQKRIEALQQLFNDKQANRVTSELEALYQNGEKILEIERLVKDAEERERSIRMMTIFLTAIAFLLFLIVLFYTKQNNLAKTLKQKNIQITTQSEELQQLNNLKDKLFSTISHDLKSPIAHFEQGLQYLLSGELKQEEFLLFAEDLKKDATHLRRSVEELMNWSYMQIIGLQPQIGKVNLKKSVDNIIQFNHQQADAKAIILDNRVASEWSILVDQEHLNSILRNLTSNAIKFSSENTEVVFDASLKEDQVILSVKDQGVGIAPQQLKNIFKVGTTEWGTAGEKGTGLGLALCKEFAEKNNGEIWAESELGKGSVFYVRLPGSAADLPTIQAVALSNAVL